MKVFDLLDILLDRNKMHLRKKYSTCRFFNIFIDTCVVNSWLLFCKANDSTIKQATFKTKELCKVSEK